MIPHGTTHIQNDGTFWKCVNGYWYYWDEIFEWCGYVGLVNSMFLKNKKEIGVFAG